MTSRDSASRWRNLTLTDDEQSALWMEIDAELRNGARPSPTSIKVADCSFWKLLKKRLKSNANECTNFRIPKKGGPDEGERALIEKLNARQPVFQALAAMNYDFFWEWKLINGLVLDLMKKVVEPAATKSSSTPKIILADGEAYRLTGDSGIDEFIMDYPALYTKWVTLMGVLVNQFLPRLYRDKRISLSEMESVDICPYDIQFTLTDQHDNHEKTSEVDFLRTVGKTSRSRAWSETSLAYKVLREHGTLRKTELTPATTPVGYHRSPRKSLLPTPPTFAYMKAHPLKMSQTAKALVKRESEKKVRPYPQKQSTHTIYTSTKAEPEQKALPLKLSQAVNTSVKPETEKKVPPLKISLKKRGVVKQKHSLCT